MFLLFSAYFKFYFWCLKSLKGATEFLVDSWVTNAFFIQNSSKVVVFFRDPPIITLTQEHQKVHRLVKHH